jgi:hypothetical protein
MGDALWALLVGFFLASLVAFRRARGVLTPEARRANTPAVVPVVVGLTALAVIVWLTRRLLT